MDNTLSQQLTPSQKRAVFHIEGPLLVLAGPGSGKTRVITHRIAALVDSGVRPYNICAITFTNKAAEEMRQRAAALGASGGAHISTFHSLCVRILRRYAGSAGVRPNFSIYDASDQARCMKQAVKDCELDATNFPPARMLDAISTLKNKLVDAESFRDYADDFFSKTLAKVYLRYQLILNERNGLDFDDLLLRTAFLLDSWPDVCSELSNRFKFLLIDEYQDTNHAQYRIASALASQHGNICATGDPDQSIYGWRGADIHNILAFETDWPDATIVKLEENFRSTPNILTVADSLIGHNHKRKLKKLLPTRQKDKDVVITASEDEAAEAGSVVRHIEELTATGASLNDIAVFYRVNSMSRVLEEAFIRSKIVYQVVRGVEFYNRKEIRDLLAYLKVLVNPDDEIALLRIINTPARGIGKVTIDRLRAYAARNQLSLFEALKHAERIDSLSKNAKARLAAFVDILRRFEKDTAGPVGPVAERLFEESGLAVALRAAADQGKDALENVNELINAAADYDRQAEQPSLIDYLQQISLFSDTDAYDPASGRVALMTLHAAKGLEFENVFIVGVEEGLLPHEKTNSYEDTDELEEERRLFFVGITRAKTGLYISYARYRTIRGQLLRTIPSRFLFELGCSFTEPADHDDDYDHEDHEQDQPGRGPPSARFTAGQLVQHESFGLGRVKEFIDIGENSIVVVKFNTGQTKSLMLKYTDLVGPF
ncbi:MAG: UvrD-helicase domain-containing protein [Planctomycetes bacterium]|nr:UvrD-helicase domain-containing protein [Planctomycetota bacterium]